MNNKQRTISTLKEDTMSTLSELKTEYIEALCDFKDTINTLIPEIFQTPKEAKTSRNVLSHKNISKLVKSVPGKLRKHYIRIKPQIMTLNRRITPDYAKKLWLGISYPAFAFVALLILAFPFKAGPNLANKYSIYMSRPLLLGSSNYGIYAKDSRSQKINEVFKMYNCPLEGLGEVFVYEADRNDIPWWLVAAISFQESSCGKKTPEVGGLESYNAWGWAVYGDNVHTFDNWVRGIETVSAYLKEKFFSRGITEPCDIMKIYTPPSKGSWCEGVNHFGELIENYKTPDL